jgi:glycosyltransferase involved in cell wall biosynthesis
MSLSSAIRRLCNSREERESLGRAAQKRVADLYDWEVITTQYEQLFAGFSD